MEVGWLVQHSPEDRISVSEQQDLQGNSSFTEINKIFLIYFSAARISVQNLL